MNKEQIISRLRAETGPPLRLHLIGVAGSGMSGLADLCLERGHSLSGSDRVSSVETDRLRTRGLRFSSPHTADAVDAVDAVVYSSAVRAGNAAYDAAVARGVPLLRRAEALAAVAAGKQVCLVAGTHGKTTTTALLAQVLRSGGRHPSHYVGAEVPLLGSNAFWDPEGRLLVAEGDESDGTLSFFQPHHLIVLNIEEDHVDHFTGIAEIQSLFADVADRATGRVVYCAEDPGAVEVCAGRPGALSYGWSMEHDFSAAVLAADGQSTDFTVLQRGEVLGRVELNIPGKHNVLNALAVIAVAVEEGVDFGSIQSAFKEFRGARRRFDRRYVGKRFTVIDDYGHHPTEVAATVATARSLEPRRLVVLFQPHRYSRTRRFMNEFGRSLGEADVVFVADVYPAGEKPIAGVSGASIVEALRREHPDCEATFIAEKSEVHWRIGSMLEPGDLLLTLGAGDVHLVAGRLAKDLEMLEALEAVMEDAHGVSRLYEPMSLHTTLRVGGPAQLWIEPRTFEAFARAVRYARANHLPLRVVGRGSNLLVRDGGLPGVVIHPAKGEFARIRVRGNNIEAGAGVRFKALAGAARAAGLGGFEWMEGIPGTVGGGLRMNAGAMGDETFPQVVSVTYLDCRSQEILSKAGSDFQVLYRNVPELEGSFALSAVFSGVPGGVEEIDRRLEASQAKRKRSQPVGSSAGCIFKNPSEIPAGRLVDELGMKGRRSGAARVSEMHGNFIVNEGSASAEDVLTLIARVQEEATDRRGITLETEVQIIGVDKPPPNRFAAA